MRDYTEAEWKIWHKALAEGREMGRMEGRSARHELEIFWTLYNLCAPSARYADIQAFIDEKFGIKRDAEENEVGVVE